MYYQDLYLFWRFNNMWLCDAKKIFVQYRYVTHGQNVKLLLLTYFVDRFKNNICIFTY